MGVPTIGAVAPTTVWTGGQVITITGTNFKPWSIPPVSPPGAALPPPTATVSVKVDGVECAEVQVYSATELTCKAPAHDPAIVSVAVTNLDDAGVAIPGETVTAAAALTYARPDLTSAPDLGRVEEQIVLDLRRQVVENIVMSVSTDWGETPFDMAAVGKLPALTLSGPSIVESRNAYATNSEIETGGYPLADHEVHRAPLTVDLSYDFIGLTDSARQLFNLHALTLQFFDRNKRLRILRDASDASKGYVYYDMEIVIGTAVRNTTEPNPSNVRSFTGSFTIYGVVVEGVAGFANETLVKRGGVVENVLISTSKF
jgi:hypothetical protein